MVLCSSKDLRVEIGIVVYVLILILRCLRMDALFLCQMTFKSNHYDLQKVSNLEIKFYSKIGCFALLVSSYKHFVDMM